LTARPGAGVLEATAWYAVTFRVLAVRVV